MIEVVSVVICYKNAQEVSSYADGLFALRESDKAFLVIVINQADATDREVLDEILLKYPNVAIVDPGENLGYMNGLILGYREYSNRYQEMPRYVFMSNTDIEYGDMRFLEDLLKREYSEDTWCIGPSVYTKYTHNYDNPVADRRRSLSEINSLIRRFSTPVINQMYVFLSGIKAKYKKSSKTDSRFVYEVHGCFFILTGSFAEQIKDETYGVLMYSEETFVSELVYCHGKKVYYDADLEVIHAEHTATKLLGTAGIANHLSKSMKYIRDRFY